MPKRGENIYKRKDGRWEGRVRKPEPSETGGKYKYIYGRTYKEVKEKMRYTKKSLSEKHVCMYGICGRRWKHGLNMARRTGNRRLTGHTGKSRRNISYRFLEI